MFSLISMPVVCFTVSSCNMVDCELMLRLSNGGRALSAVSIARLCAAVVYDLPQLCLSSLTGALLKDTALVNLMSLANESSLTEHDVRSLRVLSLRDTLVVQVEQYVCCMSVCLYVYTTTFELNDDLR